jgi:plastocyanin
MRTARLLFSPRTTVVIAALLVSACGGLAHPTSNDGNDAGNPSGVNSGATPTLSLISDSSSIAVGSGTAIHVYYNQAPLVSTSIIMASSDSTVVGCCAFGESVGSATLTYFYNGLQASIGIAVHANDAGAVAQFTGYTRNDGSFWLPDSVHVAAGSLVQFAVFAEGKHNVAFDSVPGAPSDIPTPTQTTGPVIVARTFAQAGRFPFHCTLHGETGAVVVTP